MYLNSTVMGVFEEKEVLVNMEGDRVNHYKADNIMIATGAAENMIPFKGGTNQVLLVQVRRRL